MDGCGLRLFTLDFRRCFCDGLLAPRRWPLPRRWWAPRPARRALTASSWWSAAGNLLLLLLRRRWASVISKTVLFTQRRGNCSKAIGVHGNCCWLTSCRRHGEAAKALQATVLLLLEILAQQAARGGEAGLVPRRRRRTSSHGRGGALLLGSSPSSSRPLHPQLSS